MHVLRLLVYASPCMYNLLMLYLTQLPVITSPLDLHNELLEKIQIKEEQSESSRQHPLSGNGTLHSLKPMRKSYGRGVTCLSFS